MKRLVRDALLIALGAAAVWVIRGDAQQAEPIGYGQAFQLQCQTGRIENADVSTAPLDKYTISWRPGIAPGSLKGNATLTECVAYPDLRTPTP